MLQRSIGQSGQKMWPLVCGGHGLRGGWQGKDEQSLDQAVQTMQFLANAGMTHFDYTFARERHAYREVLRAAELDGKLKPVIWYMDQDKHEGRPETCLQDVIDNVRYHLDELDCEKAGAVIRWDNRWPAEWPGYVPDAMQALKEQGLAEATGLGVLAGARANEAYLWDTWRSWDFLSHLTGTIVYDAAKCWSNLPVNVAWEFIRLVRSCVERSLTGQVCIRNWCDRG